MTTTQGAAPTAGAGRPSQPFGDGVGHRVHTLEDRDIPPVVIVYGAVRSGTTMFRLMLNSHPGISNPGEVDFLFDQLHPDATCSSGWRYDRTGLQASRIFRAHRLDLPPDQGGLDLMADILRQFAARAPGTVLTVNVHHNIRRVVRLLPHARIIHVLRDPRDVARSCVGMGWFGTSYHAASSWLEAERGWDEAAPLLSPDQVLTLPFEDLMRDLEGQLARVCAFVGVPLTPQMLGYHERSTYQPPDPSIAQQWRRKAPRSEIALIEGRCADLMAARGYPPECGPRIPGRAESALLEVRHRTRRWRFNIGRFGLPLFLANHATRLPGLRSFRPGVRRRMDDKITAWLK